VSHQYLCAKKILAGLLLVLCMTRATAQQAEGCRKMNDLLHGSAVIGLGEVAHGFASVNEAKSGFLKFLYNGSNCKAVAFESSFTASVISYLDGDAQSRAGGFLYPFWNTPVVHAALLPFLEDGQKAGKPLVTGFDMQEDCRFKKFSRYLISKRIITASIQALQAADSVLSFYIGDGTLRTVPVSTREYAVLMSNYDIVQNEILQNSRDTLIRKLLDRCITNRKWLCKYLAMSNTRQKMFFRDSLMAANIQWLKQHLYLHDKLVLWAADTHLAKASGNGSQQWMGGWLFQMFGNGFTSCSFRKGTAKEAFSCGAINLEYKILTRQPFDILFYLPQMVKIEKEQWITGCK
jgi:erythromycin esterase-like protein